MAAYFFTDYTDSIVRIDLHESARSAPREGVMSLVGPGRWLELLASLVVGSQVMISSFPGRS
jgi:hypothetical protein